MSAGRSGPAALPPSYALDGPSRRLRLDPRDPAFVQDPYPTYLALQEHSRAVYWEHYGHWCLTRHDDVSALLRDRRFGRQILHVMSRADLGWPELPAHLAPFAAYERHSLLELEPPAHTRMRMLVNRPFLLRVTEALRPHIAGIAHRCIDAFAANGRCELLRDFATPLPVAVICELLGMPLDRSAELLAWSHDIVAMYQAR
ncbi:MAG: cytochrome P450, partial [Candidatus Eisenbacteria bacterium]